jgi:hypothetical protein
MVGTATVASHSLRQHWLLVAIVVLVGVGGIGLGVAVASRHTATSVATVGPAIAPAANIAQACRSWAATSPDNGSATSWCNSMTSWMAGQIASGQMSGMMMWSDPARMLATCQAWTTASAPTSSPDGWCRAMVDWMREHAGTGGWTTGMMTGWTGTIMNGPTTP